MNHKSKKSFEEFRDWAKTATMKQVEELMKPVKEGRTISFVNQVWGHAINPEPHGSIFYKCHGFFNPYNRIKVGDFVLTKNDSGKIFKLVVAHIDYEDDPKDMFWAFIILCDKDYKPVTTETTK